MKGFLPERHLKTWSIEIGFELFWHEPEVFSVMPAGIGANDNIFWELGVNDHYFTLMCCVSRLFR